jgi:hypothetical protein
VKLGNNLSQRLPDLFATLVLLIPLPLQRCVCSGGSARCSSSPQRSAVRPEDPKGRTNGPKRRHRFATCHILANMFSLAEVQFVSQVVDTATTTTTTTITTTATIIGDQREAALTIPKLLHLLYDYSIMTEASEPNQWINVEFHGRIAIIEINRPEKLNALPKDGFYQLSQCLRDVDTHDEVSITVLMGKGRFFSACVWRHCHQRSLNSYISQRCRCISQSADSTRNRSVATWLARDRCQQSQHHASLLFAF